MPSHAACWRSLAELDYPSDRLEIIRLEAGPQPAPHPAPGLPPELPVRVLRSPQPGVEAVGNNLAARAATGQYLLFLDSSLTVNPPLLRELVRALESGPDVACAAAQIFDADSQRPLFARPALDFAGRPQPVDYTATAVPARPDQLEPILFASRQAMLLVRETFLAAGGFDEAYRAGGEVVDLGWRLWLMGFRVLLAPQARAYCQASAKPAPASAAARDSLRTIVKNYDDDNLSRVLTALPVTISGLAAAPPASQAAWELDSAQRVLAAAGARWPELFASRRSMQALRQRPDAEIVALFRRPFNVVGRHKQVMLQRAMAAGVQDIFAKLPRRVLIISPDILPYPGLPTVGSSLRAWGLGHGLRCQGHEVIFSMPRATLEGRNTDQFPEVRQLAWDPGAFDQLLRAVDPDVVVVSGWPVLPALARQGIDVPLVLDQHGPHNLERQFQAYGTLENNAADKLTALYPADFFTCAGHRQLPYFREWLKRAGWSEADCQERSAAIPISLSPELPERQPDPELTFVYGGVFLPWQDPSAGLNALSQALLEYDRVRLYLFGGRHPTLPIDPGLFEPLVEQLQQNPRVTVPGIIPHDQLVERYLRAHVALDVMKRNPERELAFTTRTVEYLWCGLPVIYHDYAELSGYIRDYEAGWVVNPEDAPALRQVLDTIFTQPDEVARRSRNAQRLVRECLTWDRTIAPLDHFVRHPRLRVHPPPPVTVRDRARQVGHLFWIAGTVLRRHGPAVLARDLWKFARRQFSAGFAWLAHRETTSS